MLQGSPQLTGSVRTQMCLALRLQHRRCLLYQTRGETHFLVKDTACLIEAQDMKLLTALSQRDSNGLCGCTSNSIFTPTGLREYTRGEVVLCRTVRARAFLAQRLWVISTEATVPLWIKLTRVRKWHCQLPVGKTSHISVTDF